MANPSDAGSGFPRRTNADHEAQLGGADAVEKTSYVTGKGTEPERRAPAGDRKGKGAPNAALLIIGTLLVLAVLIYVFRSWVT
jgi:hypothetical protein